MTPLKFWKTESIGNDFVLVEQLDVLGLDLSSLARQVCDRHFGIGSDGLLVVARNSEGLTLRMFNPDGTEDFCGNGLRCAAWHAKIEGWVEEKFSILHGGQWIPTTVADQSVSIVLPPASFAPDAVPVKSEIEFINQVVQGFNGTALSTGSAHFVVFLDELPDDDTFFEVAPRIETDASFPESISVMFTQTIGKNHLKLRIWERGAGETLGCGTGSVAAAVVWARSNSMGGEIIVTNPGGDVRVKLDSWKSPVESETCPTRVYEGSLTIDRSAVLGHTRPNVSLV